MKISDLFRQLSYGELSNLSISNSGSGEIVAAKHPQVVHYVNDALVAIFTRFSLIEKEVIIEQVTGTTLYHLHSDHSQAKGGIGVAGMYIKDTTADPFLDDAILITAVWGMYQNQVYKFPLNDQGDTTSLFTPQPLTLQVQEPVNGEGLSVMYRAYHPRLVDVPVLPATAISLDQIIDIPHYLDNALQKWVAAEVFSHMNGQENLIKSQEYRADYEALCLGIEQRDLAHQTWHTSHTKLEQRGFV